jgi:hypothetical protein
MVVHEDVRKRAICTAQNPSSELYRATRGHSGIQRFSIGLALTKVNILVMIMETNYETTTKKDEKFWKQRRGSKYQPAKNETYIDQLAKLRQCICLRPCNCACLRYDLFPQPNLSKVLDQSLYVRGTLKHVTNMCSASPPLSQGLSQRDWPPALWNPPNRPWGIRSRGSASRELEVMVVARTISLGVSKCVLFYRIDSLVVTPNLARGCDPCMTKGWMY